LSADIDFDRRDIQATLSRVVRLMRGMALPGLLAGCAVVGGNEPHNLARPATSPESFASKADGLDAVLDRPREDVVALSFSGGGLRAAAFSLGAMKGLSTLPGGEGVSLLQEVQFITSVSGGSITGAWVGLNGTESLADFERHALRHTGHVEMQPYVMNSVSLLRLAGDGLSTWLDEEVFHGAKFAGMHGAGRPTVWINATNLNQGVPFVFNRGTFEALCSDIDTYPVADAVAASMAVPPIFSPIVIEKRDHCGTGLLRPAIEAAEADRSMQGQATRRALSDYSDLSSGKYLKLADGGLTDNLGLSGIQQVRLIEQKPLAPLSDAQAMSLRRLLFVVVDGGQRPDASWTRDVAGPGGLSLAYAAIDAAIDTNMRLSFDNFVANGRRWREDLAAWRCARPVEEQQRQRDLRPGWRCDDVEIAISRIAFDDLPGDRARLLHAVPTSLTLSEAEIRTVVAAGEDAMRGNAVVARFVGRASSDP